MDKLNKELIQAKDSLTIIEDKIVALHTQAQFLQDKLHLYLESPTHDTADIESHIISSFWSSAYEKYVDGGYITNDPYIPEVRFNYETELIDKIIANECKNKVKAIDICCGNGRYTKEFAHKFKTAIGIDFSKSQIKCNQESNKDTNINYISADFMTMDSSALGTFDLVFVGDIFMYTHVKNIQRVFKNILKLVSKNGVLLIRESANNLGHENYKSKNYVAYYRNKKFYKKGIFKKHFQKSYRNYGYNLYHLDKYFSVFSGAREKIKNSPSLLKKAVKKSVDKHCRRSYFYVYKK